MKIRHCDPKSIDPNAFSVRPGVALVAFSDSGERLGSIAARVDGAVASVFEQWVAGEPQVLEGLLGELVTALRRDHGVSELRAGATDANLYRFYRERAGLSPWSDVVTYERPAGRENPPRRSNTQVRPFRSADEPAVTKLLGKEGFADLARLSGQYPSRFIVAVAGHEAVGYAFAYVDGPSCLFKSMVVDDAFRGRGIGWDLTAHILEWCDGLGLPSYLHTQSDNAVARRLYERLGYQEAGQTRLLHKAIA